MIIIEDNDILIARGNTGNFDLVIEDSVGTSYKLESGDLLEFGVKKGCDYDERLIHITDWTESSIESAGGTIYIYTFTINPEDTTELEFGNYRYDVTLTRNNGSVDTIVRDQLFMVCRTVNT